MLLSERQIIELVAQAVSRDLVPELSSPGARSLATMAVDALRELLKRHAILPELVRRQAPAGLDLARQLPGLGQPLDEEAMREIEQGLASGPAEQAGAFDRLVAILDAGASRIIAKRADMEPSRSAQASTWLRQASAWDRNYYESFARAPLPPLSDGPDAPRPLTPDKLAAHLRGRLDQPQLEVANMSLVPGGMLNEIFFCTLRIPGRQDREVVVRKNVKQPLFTHGAHRVREEFFILKCISDHGLPVPEPLWLVRDLPEVDGDFYVQSRASGHMVGGLMGAHSKLSERLLFSLAEFLARLHAIPSAAFAPYFEGPESPVRPGESVRDAVARNVENVSRVWLDGHRKPAPSEAFALDWLRRNIPDNRNPAVMVHTDCFVHNFLVEDDRIACVLDWECAHFGDPAEDLAYIKAYVSEHLPWDRFVARYREAGGQPILEQHIDYYTALLHFRNFWGCNIGAARADLGFSDVRLIPLGSEHRTRYMGLCLDAIASSGLD